MGREKTREGGERRGRTLGQEGWAGVKCGAELGASHYGAELGAKIFGAELGARVNGVEPSGRSSTVPRSSAPVFLVPRLVSVPS